MKILVTGDAGFIGSAVVRTVQDRQGQQVGCLEEIAFRNGWIDQAKLLAQADVFGKNGYGAYLRGLGQ